MLVQNKGKFMRIVRVSVKKPLIDALNLTHSIFKLPSNSVPSSCCNIFFKMVLGAMPLREILEQ